MKNKLFILLCFLIFSVKLDAQYTLLTPTWEWGVDFNGTIISSLVHNNYIYTFGNYSDSSIHLGAFSLPNAGGTDSYIAKWDTLGNVIWAINISDTSNQRAMRLHINLNNDLVAVGNNSSPSLMIGMDTIPSGINNGIYTATIDLNGNILDAFSIPSTSDSDFCIDNANNLYYATNFGLFKYSSSGIQIWHKPQIIVDKISYSALLDCLLGIGNFDDTLTIETSSVTESFTYAFDAQDLFGVSVDLNGNLKWLVQLTNNARPDWISDTYMDQTTGELFLSTHGQGFGYHFNRIGKMDSTCGPCYTFISNNSPDHFVFNQIRKKDSLLMFSEKVVYPSIGTFGSLKLVKPPNIYPTLNYNCVVNHLVFEGPSSIYISGSAGATTHSFGKLGYTLLASSYVPTTTVCVGSLVKFKSNIVGGGLPYTYSWAPTTGLSTTNADSIEFIATSSITYTLTVTDSYGQVITKTYDLIVDTPITSMIVPDFPTFCHDSMILYSVPPIEGYWYKIDGTSLSPVYPHSYDSFTVINSPGLYLFFKYNSCGYVKDSLQIDPTSPVTANSTSSGFCQGQSVTLSGGGANSYSWTSGVLDNISFIPSATQTYLVTGIDTNGCSDTASIQVVVYPPTSSTTNVSICQVSLPYVWNSQVINSSGTYTSTFLNSNGCDSISNLNLSIHTSSSNNIILNICSSDLPYMWNSQFLDTAGVYTANLSNSWGCDSLVTLDLSVTPSSNSSTSDTICSASLPYVWNTQSLTTSGTYTSAFTNSLGCDSIATLNLTVNPTSASTTSTTICSTALPYAWNSQSLTSSGIYISIFTNALGCDSVATLNLTVNPISASTTNTTICSSSLPYVWNSQALTSSGSYTSIFTNALGCDSIATLNLTANPTGASTTNTTICSSLLPYVWNSQALTSSGTYTSIFTNAVGCDSIATLNLTANPTGANTTNTTICSSLLPYVWNSQSLTSSGTYTSTFTNAFGCDSIATLNLTVNPIPIVTIIPGSDSTICIGASYMLEVGNSFTSYAWSLNSSSISSVNTVAITDSGTYIVSCVDSNGCIGSDSVHIYMTPIPDPLIVQSNDTLICTNANNVSYLWHFNGANIGTDSTLIITQNGVYYVKVTDSIGCIGFDTLMVIGLGINDISTSENISVYPNPSSELIHIEVELNESSPLELKLIDAQGRVVWMIKYEEKTSGKYNEHINLKSLGLKSGVYLLTGRTLSNQWTKRIVYLDK